MFSLETYLQEKRTQIDEELERRLPVSTTAPAVLHEAMRYTVFSGGKRLRPIMCMVAAEAVQGKAESVVLPATAVELLHTYSLVHDDLPLMDNDEIRRGQPTCHVKYGEANALLVGDALLTMAFECLAKTDTVSSPAVQTMIVELARAAGSQGMVAGQAEDIKYMTREFPGQDVVTFVHRHKTAALFTASVRIGAIGGGASENALAALTSYAEKFGLAFQIIDDIDDREEDKMLSAVTRYGIEGAKDKARELVESAVAELDGISSDVQPLRSLAAFILKPIS